MKINLTPGYYWVRERQGLTYPNGKARPYDPTPWVVRFDADFPSEVVGCGTDEYTRIEDIEFIGDKIVPPKECDGRANV